MQVHTISGSVRRTQTQTHIIRVVDSNAARGCCAGKVKINKPGKVLKLTKMLTKVM